MTNIRVAFFFALFLMFGSVLWGTYYYMKKEAERRHAVSTPSATYEH